MSADERIRLFLALELPRSTRRSLAQWGAEAFAAAADLRQVAASDLHVTLAFLGWRPAAEVQEVWRLATEATASLTLPRFEPGPVLPTPRRRPRLLALDLGDPTGAGGAWHAAVSQRLAAAGLYEPEKRPFWPHVTIARGRKGARVRPPAEGPQLAPFDAYALTLYRSELSRSGARYTALESTARS